MYAITFVGIIDTLISSLPKGVTKRGQTHFGQKRV